MRGREVTPPFTVIIKTFMRPRCCVKVVQSWKSQYPEADIIVVDDGPPELKPNLKGISRVRHIRTEFDIGLSAGRNIGVSEAKTDLVFICDDDNVCRRDCDIAGAASQMEKYDIDIAGVGAYFFEIDEAAGELHVSGYPVVSGVVFCGIVLNHFLATRSSMPRWDEAIKIGFEHPDFFLDCRKLGVKVAATPLIRFRKALAAAQREGGRKYLDFRRHRRETYQRIFESKRGLSYGRWRHIRSGMDVGEFLEATKSMGLKEKNCLVDSTPKPMSQDKNA
jgi:glycosyltransferase involved in cell wall biosynthesis